MWLIILLCMSVCVMGGGGEMIFKDKMYMLILIKVLNDKN